MQWSRTRPLVFAAAASSGSVYLYDLSVSLSVPVTEFRSPAVQIPVTSSRSRGGRGGGGDDNDDDDDDDDDFQEAKSGRGKGSSAAGGGGQALFSNGGAAVHAVSFNPKMRAFFAFGDAAGGVHVLKMPEALANVKSGEEQDLAKIAGNLAEDGADE